MNSILQALFIMTCAWRADGLVVAPYEPEYQDIVRVTASVGSNGLAESEREGASQERCFDRVNVRCLSVADDWAFHPRLEIKRSSGAVSDGLEYPATYPMLVVQSSRRLSEECDVIIGVTAQDYKDDGFGVLRWQFQAKVLPVADAQWGIPLPGVLGLRESSKAAIDLYVIRRNRTTGSTSIVSYSYFMRAHMRDMHLDLETMSMHLGANDNVRQLPSVTSAHSVSLLWRNRSIAYMQMYALSSSASKPPSVVTSDLHGLLFVDQTAIDSLAVPVMNYDTGVTLPGEPLSLTGGSMRLPDTPIIPMHIRITNVTPGVRNLHMDMNLRIARIGRDSPVGWEWSSLYSFLGQSPRRPFLQENAKGNIDLHYPLYSHDSTRQHTLDGYIMIKDGMDILYTAVVDIDVAPGHPTLLIDCDMSEE